MLIDRVVVTTDAVEIRYVIPTAARSEHTRFCHLRADYLRREPMPLVAGGGCLFIHAPSIAYSPVREIAQLT